jgi:CHAD domain-containing protein
MALSLTPSHFVTKMEENVKRVEDRLNDYIKDSNENNIHDIRTATRRLDASFISLPKKMRRKTKIRKYVTTSKQLFKVNSQVRDYDIFRKATKTLLRANLSQAHRIIERKKKNKTS